MNIPKVAPAKRNTVLAAEWTAAAMVVGLTLWWLRPPPWSEHVWALSVVAVWLLLKLTPCVSCALEQLQAGPQQACGLFAARSSAQAARLALATAVWAAICSVVVVLPAWNGNAWQALLGAFIVCHFFLVRGSTGCADCRPAVARPWGDYRGRGSDELDDIRRAIRSCEESIDGAEFDLMLFQARLDQTKERLGEYKQRLIRRRARNPADGSEL